MKLYQYLDANGNFDYERYQMFQIQANHAKIKNNWVYEPSIKFLAQYVVRRLGPVRFGLCHGTRRGNEQVWFRKYIENSEIFGTEISDTAVDFPFTIQHDFQEELEGWVGKADFVYSNSWDHAYDPAKMFREWMKSLRLGGLTIIEHTDGHLPINAGSSDPFGIDVDELLEFLHRSGDGHYVIDDVLKDFDFEIPDWYGNLNYIVLRNL